MKGGNVKEGEGYPNSNLRGGRRHGRKGERGGGGEGEATGNREEWSVEIMRALEGGVRFEERNRCGKHERFRVAKRRNPKRRRRSAGKGDEKGDDKDLDNEGGRRRDGDRRRGVGEGEVERTGGE